MKNKSIKLYLISFLGFIIAILMDQYTKYLAVEHLQEKSVSIWEGVFQLQYLENKGAAFGIMENKQWFFLIIAGIISALILYAFVRMPQTKKFHLLRVCLIFISAGAIGNMIDRIRFHYVVDFLYFELINFPIFNVADIYVTVATFGLAIAVLFYYTDEDFDLLSKSIFPRSKKVKEAERE